MRKGIILFLSLFIFLSTCIEVLAGLSVHAQLQASEEQVNPYEWDFGQVKQGVISKHDFIFKNETNDILEINSIYTSCGCTVSESDKKSLLPQASTTISVSFNSKGYSGAVQQFVYVNTDNADLPIVKFTIKASVVKD